MEIRVLITGDYCPIGRNQEKIEKGDLDSLFGSFKEIINDVHFSVTNLECPITNHTAPILKSGPNIKGPTGSILGLKEIGFNLVTLANNHILDFGEDGVQDTIKLCHNNGINTVGAGESLEAARKFFIEEIQGRKFAFINLAENEFCAATISSYGANPLNLATNYKDIQTAKKLADYVIVIAHGGREHYQLPTPNVRERYRFFIDAGADVVVAHHPHCVSGYESYNEGKIFYSLGNFIFDYKVKYQKGDWTEGMSVILKFSDNGIDFETIPHFQGRREDPTFQLMVGDDKKEFQLKLDSLNQKIANDKVFFESWDNYITSQINNYFGLLFLGNRFVRIAVIKGLLPFFKYISLARKTLLLNLFRCETHREITIEVLRRKLKQKN